MFKSKKDKNTTIELVENVTTLADALDIFKNQLTTEQTPSVFGSHYLSYRVSDTSDTIDVVYTDQNNSSYTHKIQGDGQDVINLYFNDANVVKSDKPNVQRVLIRVDVVNDKATSNQYFS